ncbi:MAG: hypothetical protein R3C53_06460 [Pirellulaceae bacterium]
MSKAGDQLEQHAVTFLKARLGERTCLARYNLTDSQLSEFLGKPETLLMIDLSRTMRFAK